MGDFGDFFGHWGLRREGDRHIYDIADMPIMPDSRYGVKPACR